MTDQYTPSTEEHEAEAKRLAMKKHSKHSLPAVVAVLLGAGPLYFFWEYPGWCFWPVSIAAFVSMVWFYVRTTGKSDYRCDFCNADRSLLKKQNYRPPTRCPNGGAEYRWYRCDSCGKENARYQVDASNNHGGM